MWTQVFHYSAYIASKTLFRIVYMEKDTLILQSNGVLKIKFGSRRNALRRVFDLDFSGIHLTEKILKFRVINRQYGINVSVCEIELGCCFLPDESKLCWNSASYEYTNTYVFRLKEGHNLYPIEFRLSVGNRYCDMATYDGQHNNPPPTKYHIKDICSTLNFTHLIVTSYMKNYCTKDKNANII